MKNSTSSFVDISALFHEVNVLQSDQDICKQKLQAARELAELDRGQFAGLAQRVAYWNQRMMLAQNILVQKLSFIEQLSQPA